MMNRSGHGWHQEADHWNQHFMSGPVKGVKNPKYPHPPG